MMTADEKFDALWDANRVNKKEYMKKWRAKNKDKRAAYQKAWKQANPGYQKAWAVANREKINTYARAWYLEQVKKQYTK